MNYYIHNINPIIYHIGGPLAIRWYGIAYLLGFIACILFLRHWSKKQEFHVPLHEVSNFVVGMAFFGVFIGGRVGYVLLYGFNYFLADPTYLFKVWEGGMSSHGGMMGVIIYLLWYARKHNHTFWNLADNLASVTSLGFAFGRIANFINGELWGRVTEVKWGVIFPQTLGLQYGQYTVDQIQAMNLQARHPSQLYQAATEGILVFIIMLILRKLPIAKKEGFLSASYFVLYAIARIIMECFREPDEGQAIILGLTKGQLFSTFMIIASIVVYIKIFRKPKKA